MESLSIMRQCQPANQTFTLKFLLLLLLLTSPAQFVSGQYTSLYSLHIFSRKIGDSPSAYFSQKGGIALSSSDGTTPNTLSLNIPASITRLYIHLTFAETYNNAPNYVRLQPTGDYLTNDVKFEVPLTMSTGTNLFYLESPEFTAVIPGLFTISVQKAGWAMQIWSYLPDYPDSSNQLTHCVPGRSYQLRILPSSQLDFSDRDYDIQVTSGRLSSRNITFFKSPGPADSYIYFTPDWTSQADMVLLTFVRNWQHAPPTSNAIYDDWEYGDPPPFQIPIVPNVVCGSDDGHIILDPQYSLTTSMGSDSFIGQDITACYWQRPTLFSAENQVWLSLGPVPDDLQMGIYGSKDPNGGLFGSPFMQVGSFNQPGNASTYVPYDNANTMLNLDQWSHVCHVYKFAANDALNLGRKTMQLFLNGAPANQPVSLSQDWGGDPTFSYPLTIGSRSDGTQPAYGGFDELNVFSYGLTALAIYAGYTTGFSNAYLRTTFSEQSGRSVGSWTTNGVGDPIWSKQDPICTAMAPSPGTLNKLSGRDCIQPLSTVTGVGLAEVQDGQLQVGLNGDTTTGGAVWYGLSNQGSYDFRSAPIKNWLVCVWVKRNANYGSSKQQTIWSWGSQNHAGEGLASFSFLGDNIQMSYGKSRTDNTLAALPRSTDSGLYTKTSDDVGLWIHWCMKSVPFSAATFTLAPYRHITRNGQWWHTEILTADFQSDIQNTVKVTDNIFTIGGMPFSANPYPLDGTLDELRIYFGDSILLDDIRNNYLIDSSWSPNYDDNAVSYVPFNDIQKGSTPITGYFTTGPRYDQSYEYQTYQILVGSSTNSLTNGTDLTCVKIGTAWLDDDSQMGDSTQPYVHQYLGLHQYGTTNTDYIATSKELGEALTLATHTYTFKNRDFSFCYWVKRTTASFDTAVTGGISYDLSIGTTIGGTSTMMWSGQMTAASSGTTYYQFAFNSDSLTVPASTVHSNLDTKRWIQVCGTYASKTIHTTAIRKLYRMGILIGQDSPTTDLQSDAPITVGSRADGIFGLSGLHYYDEIRIWTRTITTDDIVSHLNTQAYTGTHPSPVMTFSFTSRSGKGPTATPNNEVLQCSTSCLYKSKTDGGQVTVSLNVPSMCPLGTYADGSLMQTSLAYNPSSSTTSPIAAGTGQYYAETTADELQLSGNVYTVAMWIKRTDINMPSTLLTIGCSTAEHSFRFYPEPDSQSPTFGLYTNMQIYLSQPSPEVLLGSVLPISGVWQGVGDWSLVLIQFQGSRLPLENDPYFMVAKDKTSSDPIPVQHSGGSPTEWDIDSCKTSRFRVTIGSDTTGTKGFSGFIDDFRLWSRYLTSQELNSIGSRTSEFVPQYDSIGYHTSTRGLTYGLQLSFNFAEQSGVNAYSLHDMTSSTGPQFTRMTQPVNSATEPQWFGSGLTTYLSSGYQNISHPLYPTTMPLAENSITCQKTTLSGRPFMIVSSDLSRDFGMRANGQPVEASIVWLQQLGLQGLSVHIVAPSDVTVLPSVITYSNGEGGFNESFRAPRTFMIIAYRAQVVTLSFFLTGPEALRYNNPSYSPTVSLIPSYQFNAYTDFISLDIGCVYLHDDGVSTDKYYPWTHDGGILPWDLDNPSTGAAAAGVDSTQINACAVTFTRAFNDESVTSVPVLITSADNTIIASFNMQASPSQYNLSGTAATPVWSNYFLIPANVVTFKVTSLRGTFIFLLNRFTRQEYYTINYNGSTSATPSVGNNFTMSLSNALTDRLTLNFTSLLAGVVIIPQTITFASKVDSQQFNLSFTFPPSHPARKALQIDYTCSGYGCDEIANPSSSLIFSLTAPDQAEILSVDIVAPSLAMNWTQNGLYQYNFTTARTPISANLSYTYNSTYHMHLYLDQPLQTIEWELVEDSAPNIVAPSSLTHSIDVSSTSSQDIPIALLNFLGPSHAGGTHMLYVRTSTQTNVTKMWYFSLTFVIDLTQVQLLCSSTIDSGSIVKQLNPPGQRTFDITLDQQQNVSQVQKVEITGAYDGCALRFTSSSVATGPFDVLKAKIGGSSSTTIAKGWIPTIANGRTFTMTPLAINLTLGFDPLVFVIMAPNSGAYIYIIPTDMSGIEQQSAFAASLYRLDMDPGTAASTPLTLPTPSWLRLLNTGSSFEARYLANYTFDINVADTMAFKLSRMNPAASVKYFFVEAVAGYNFSQYGTNNVIPPDSLWNTSTNAATVLVSNLLELTTYQLWVKVEYPGFLPFRSVYYIEVQTNEKLVKQTWLTAIVFQTNPSAGSDGNTNPNQSTNSSITTPATTIPSNATNVNTNTNSSVPAATIPATGATTPNAPTGSTPAATSPAPATDQNATSLTNGTSSSSNGRSTLTTSTSKASNTSLPQVTKTITPTPYQYNYSITLDSNTTSLSFYVQQANSAATMEYTFDATTATVTSNKQSLTQNVVVVESSVETGLSYVLLIYSRYSTVTTVYTITINIDAVKLVPCSGDNSCLYGGSCLAADGSPATTTEGTCQCKERFSGPRCQLGVLYCLDNCIIPAAPSNSSAVVYSNVSLIVIGVDGLTDIQVGDYLIPSSQFLIESLPASDSRVQQALSQRSKNWDPSVTQLQSYSLVTISVLTSKVVTPVVVITPPTNGNSSSSSSSTGVDSNSTISSSSSTAMDTNGTSSSSSSSSSSSYTADSSSSSTSSPTGSSSSSTASSRRLLSSSSSFLTSHYSPILFASDSTTSSSNGRHLTLTFNSRFEYVSRSTSYTDLAYQSAYATCNGGGADWKPDPNDSQRCLPCPNGGICIGGGIVWPNTGFWSPNEKTPPTSCILGEDQCPGVNEDTLDRTPDGSVNTQLCTDSYQGVVCTRCEANHYQSGSQCFPCADSASEQAQLAGLLIFGIAVMSSLSFAVAFASSQALALIVVMFVLLQQAIAVGKDSSASWPSRFKSLSDMFNALGIVNFDLTFMKPGCIAPTYSFISTYYGTLLFALIAFLMFMLSCLIRRQLKFFWNKAQYLLEKREQYKQNDISLKAKEKTQAQVEKENGQWEKRQDVRRTSEHQAIRIDFKRRLIHATMILGSLFYLKISTLNVNGLLCTLIPRPTGLDITDTDAVMAGDMRVLRSDATIECWMGSHLFTSIVISFLLALFTFGFPLVCCIVLTRAFAPIILRNQKSGNTAMKRFFTWMGFTKNSGLDVDSSGVAVTSATSVVRLASKHRQASLHHAASLEKDYLQRRIESELRQAEEQRGRKLTVKEVKDISEETRLNEEQSALHIVHMELFGYLFRGLKNERYFFKLFAFPISFSFALVLIFVDDVLLRTFMLGLLNCVNAAANSWLIPFIAWQDNMLGCGLPLASVYYTIGVLSLVQGTGSKWYMLILFFIAIAITAQFFFQIIRKRPKIVNADLKDKKAVEMARINTVMDLGEDDEEEQEQNIATAKNPSPQKLDIPKGLHRFSAEDHNDSDEEEEQVNHAGKFTGLVSLPASPEPVDVPVVRLHMNMNDAATETSNGEIPFAGPDVDDQPTTMDELPPLRVQPVQQHNYPIFPSDLNNPQQFAAKAKAGRRSRRSAGASTSSSRPASNRGSRAPSSAASPAPSPRRVASPSIQTQSEDHLMSIRLEGGYSQPIFKSSPSRPTSPSITDSQRALASTPRKVRAVQPGSGVKTPSASSSESPRSCLDLCIGTTPRSTMKPT